MYNKQNNKLSLWTSGVGWFRSPSDNFRCNEVLVSVSYLTTVGDAVSVVECVASSTSVLLGLWFGFSFV